MALKSLTAGAGTDIFKALALGARAVGLGKPVAYSMSAYGQEGIGEHRSDPLPRWDRPCADASQERTALVGLVACG